MHTKGANKREPTSGSASQARLPVSTTGRMGCGKYPEIIQNSPVFQSWYLDFPVDYEAPRDDRIGDMQRRCVTVGPQAPFPQK